MKVWEVNGREVGLKRDTNKFKAELIDDCKRVAIMSAKFARAFEKEWRDNISFWDKTDLVTSPAVEDWRCGSFGPDNNVCMRLELHKGRCSDFFSPADDNEIIRLEAIRRKEELGEILGRPMHSTSSQKYDLRRLRAILKAEK